MNDNAERLISRLSVDNGELVAELRHAHHIIHNALNLMTTEQQLQLATINERDGVAGEGATRYNERSALLKRFSDGGTSAG